MSNIQYFIVGGYVRDKLLGIKSKDVDFAVEAESYAAMKQDLIEKGVSIYLETPEYFTIRGSHPTYGGVDYVLCRADGLYIDGRHPESVTAGTLMDDLRRRDFTIGSMAIKVGTNTLIDPFNGQQDIKDKLIRCVGDPYDKFKDDALRILRAIRFAIKLGFEIELDTYEAMMDLGDSIKILPEERIREELDKCFRFNTPKTLEYLNEFNLISVIFQGSNLWLMPTNKYR